VLSITTLTLAAAVGRRRESETLAREARAEATAALAVQEQFLGVASHELRTPLTVIIANLQLLARWFARETPVPAVEARERIEETELQAQRLARLVTDLLDVSRMQQGYFALERSEVDLGALAGSVLQRFRGYPALSPQQTLVLEAPEPVVGWWDEGRLDQVLTNLVGNAIKFSERGRITVRVAAEGETATLEVADEGDGIAAERLGMLFEPFTPHGPNSGAGLGLYISKQLVERHNGTIDVESELEAGTTFRIRLPLGGAAERY
jgi:signal transduction histidine kinase